MFPRDAVGYLQKKWFPRQQHVGTEDRTDRFQNRRMGAEPPDELMGEVQVGQPDFGFAPSPVGFQGVELRPVARHLGFREDLQAGQISLALPQFRPGALQGCRWHPVRTSSGLLHDAVTG